MIERNISSSIVIPKEKTTETYIKKEEVIYLSFIPCKMNQEDIEEVCLILQDVFNNPRIFDEVYD